VCIANEFYSETEFTIRAIPEFESASPLRSLGNEEVNSLNSSRGPPISISCRLRTMDKTACVPHAFWSTYRELGPKLGE
jgi:hypothetical protein